MNTPILTLPTTVHLNPREDIQVVGANLTQLDEDFSLIIDVLNMSDAIAEKVVFQVKFSDAFGKFLFDGTEFVFTGDEAHVLPGEVYYFPPFVLDERFRTARAVSVRIESVDFQGGVHLAYEVREESAFTLPILTLEKEEKIHNTFGKDVITYGENMVTAWRCVCGCTNDRDTSECRNCSRNKNFVLNHLTEPFMNLKLLSKMEKEGVKKPNLAFTQTQLTRAPETTQIIQEKRQNPGVPGKKVRKRRSPFTYLLFLLLFGVLAFGAYGFLRAQSEEMSYTGDIEKGAAAYEEGDYDRALELYQKANETKPSQEISEKVEEMSRMSKSKASYLRGMELMGQKEYLQALRFFREVLPDDKHFYKSAQDEIARLEDLVLSRCRKFLDEGRREEAMALINAYIKAVPDSADAVNLRDSITTPEVASPEEKEKIEEAKNKEEEEERKNLSPPDRSKMAEQAGNLLHSYQTIVTFEANLREGPSLDSKILTILPAGTDVYVKDTLIEGVERVWCRVEVLDPKNEAVAEGWVSSRVVERAKNQRNVPEFVDKNNP